MKNLHHMSLMRPIYWFYLHLSWPSSLHSPSFETILAIITFLYITHIRYSSFKIFHISDLPQLALSTEFPRYKPITTIVMLTSHFPPYKSASAFLFLTTEIILYCLPQMESSTLWIFLPYVLSLHRFFSARFYIRFFLITDLPT